MSKQLVADSAVEAYDSYVFASFGSSFDGHKADVLAFYAAEACSAAARDRAVNEVTRTYYASLREQMCALCAFA